MNWGIDGGGLYCEERIKHVVPTQSVFIRGSNKLVYERGTEINPWPVGV